MSSFLSSVARYYLDLLTQDEWERTVFVFPNHRSSVFFSNALCSLLGETEPAGSHKVIFGLRVTTFGDLLRKGQDLSVADQVTLRCELYRAYKEVTSRTHGQQENGSDSGSHPVRRHDFESFYSWAGIIANDFSDIDKSLVEPVKIYSNITSLQQLSDEMDYLSDRQRKAIEDFWHILFEEKVDAMGEKRLVHRRFIEDFRLMDDLYNTFRANLLANGLVYPAMLLRMAAENPSDWKWDEDGVRYAFVGFSLLSPAEEVVMRRLAHAHSEDGRPRADFFWDYQDDMLKEPEGVGKHGAGYAIRRWATDPDFKAPSGFTPPSGVAPEQQKIRLIETAYPLSQPSVLAHILGHSEDGGNGVHSVVVLPDQQMLLPVMSAIPQSVTDVNVTMGYELRFAQVSSFARLVADLFNPVWLRLRKDEGGVLFNARVVLSLLRHPYVVRCDGLGPTRKAVSQITKGNVAFVSKDDVSGLSLTTAILNLVPQSVDSLPVTTACLPVSSLCDALLSVFSCVYNSFAESGERDIDRETIWEALKVIRRLGIVFDLVKDDVSDIRLLLRIMCSMIDQQKVDFQGMPFGGLQVMGILETRAIDFDDVVVLDMIEGAWPPPRQSVDTMIPLFLRNANGMVTPDDVDSTYNYYFYRLMGRARRVTFLRPTAVSGTRQSQLSRYVLQLQKLFGRHIDVVSAQKGIIPQESVPIVVDKRTVEHALRCAGGNDDGLRISPSGLSDYVTCPMHFYFKRILGLSPDDEINEEADSRQLGLIYHAIMEELYKPRGVVLSQEFIDHQLRRLDDGRLDSLILDKFSQVMHARKINSPNELNGRNILTFFTIKKIVRLTLATEQPGTTIVDTEERVGRLPFTLPDGRTVILNGSVDRQHISPAPEETYYVADYKTGRVDSMSVNSLADLFDAKEHKKNKAILQVLMYCYFLRHKPVNPVTSPMTPYVIKVRALSSDMRHVKDWLASGGVANPDRLPILGSKKSGEVLVYAGSVESEFERLLAEKIGEIFNLDIPFVQVSDPDSCKNCDFNKICRRKLRIV